MITPTRNFKPYVATRPVHVKKVYRIYREMGLQVRKKSPKRRVLTVVDTFSCVSPVIDPRFSYKGDDVVVTLDRVCRKIGFPATIRVDNGSEVILRDTDLWAYQRGVTFDFSSPGKPTDNAFIEAFNSKFRAECLNAHWFLSLSVACEKMEEWRGYYNEARPHSAIGNITPAMLANSRDDTSPSC